jgi:uncharacterized membrane protein SirB2
VSAVALSFCGFAARGIGVLRRAPWVRRRLARTLPHIVDTVLLLSALGMLWIVKLSPWAAPWLRAKIAGLILYVALGVVALRPAYAGYEGRWRSLRLAAWVGAVLVFLYIVSVALTKTPLGAVLWIKGAA